MSGENTFLINDFIRAQSWFYGLSENQLNQDNNAAVLIESTPPNFNFMNDARVDEKGGRVTTNAKLVAFKNNPISIYTYRFLTNLCL